MFIYPSFIHYTYTPLKPLFFYPFKTSSSSFFLAHTHILPNRLNPRTHGWGVVQNTELWKMAVRLFMLLPVADELHLNLHSTPLSNDGWQHFYIDRSPGKVYILTTLLFCIFFYPVSPSSSWHAHSAVLCYLPPMS